MLYDVIIIGAGPAGLSAAARAHANNLEYLVLEKGVIGNTLDYYYQYGKFVMSQPQSIPLRSDIPFEAGSREQVLETWGNYVSNNELKINSLESANEISKKNGNFEIKTSKDSYTAKNTVLAIGKLGNPRKLGVPGEDLESVSDRLVNPEDYTNQDILVVGGGDSAVEVALALSETNKVSISYRKSEFFRMNSDLLNQVNEKVDNKKIRIYFNSNVKSFEEGFTNLVTPDRELKIKTDAVFVKIGAEIPRPFLEKTGIEFSSDERTALPVIDEKYQTNISGLYVIGAVGGKDLIKSALNEGYEVIEIISGKEVEPVDEPIIKEKLALIEGENTNIKLDYICKKIPLLSNLQTKALRELITQSEINLKKKDETIYKEGDYSTTFFCIIEGTVQALYEDNPEKEVFLRSGEFFGEVSLLADRRRTSTIKCLEKSLVIEIPRRTILKLINSEPSIKRLIDESFSLSTLQASLSINIYNYEFREIAPSLEIQTYKKGETIYSEHEEADVFYIIRKGSVRITKRSSDGTEYIINYLQAGNYIGEEALLTDEHKRETTISAATEAELVKIPKESFHTLLKNRPELVNMLNTELESRRVKVLAILKDPPEDGMDDTFVSNFIKFGVVESTDILIIDEKKCIRCDNCVSACASTHNGQTRLDRRPGPSFSNIHVPIACRHCEGSPCLQDCPPGDAILRDSDGVVKIDEDKCIGCGNCANFCPYGVIFMVEKINRPNFLQGIWQEAVTLFQSGKSEYQSKSEVKQGIAVKCDLCENLDSGPACVRSCPTGAAIRVNPDYFKKVEFS